MRKRETEGGRERGGKGEAVLEIHRSSTDYLTNTEKTGDSRRLMQAKQPPAERDKGHPRQPW